MQNLNVLDRISLNISSEEVLHFLFNLWHINRALLAGLSTPPATNVLQWRSDAMEVLEFLIITSVRKNNNGKVFMRSMIREGFVRGTYP